jgi:WW domain
MYYHRIPLPADDANCDEMSDCFGRQRHSSHRQDMNGVGSFMNPSRTLFVGNLTRSKYESPKALEDAVWRHFSEWGELENVNVVHRLSIAFPRYRLRTSAGKLNDVILSSARRHRVSFIAHPLYCQSDPIRPDFFLSLPYISLILTSPICPPEFAKEAMTCQTLDWKEVLSIRWAHDDPNPIAQNSISMADKDALTAFLDARGVSTEVSNFNGPLDYHVPDPKRAKLTDCLDEYPEVAYPDTDGQYATTQPLSIPGGQESGTGPGIYSLNAAAGLTHFAGSSTGTDTAQTAVEGEPGPLCVRDYTAFFSTLSAPQDSFSSSSVGNGQIVADGSKLHVDDQLDKKRLLMSLGLDSYLEGSAEETKVVPPGLAIAEITVAAGDEKFRKAETSRSEEVAEEEESDGDDEEEEDEGFDGWTTHVDPETGATYYHNRSTGESSWGSAPAP